MNNFVADFETYYSKADGVSAGDLGNANYVANSYAYIVSVVGENLQWVGTIDEAQKKFPDSFWRDPENQFWAAHSNFDQAWSEKYFCPSVRPWKCILDRGATQQLPHNVAGLAKVVLGKTVDKTLRDWMDGKHWAEITPEQQKQMLDYCLGDSIEEHALLKAIPEPSATEDALAEHTRRINRVGIHVDTERLDQDRIRLHEFRHKAFCAIPWHNDAKPLSYPALVKYCGQKGLPVPKTLDKKDEETTELLDVHEGLAEVVGAMRRFRRANTLIKKLESVEARLTHHADDEATIPLEMMYCGARHTRRWSSRGVNIQNLDREPLWVDPAKEKAHAETTKGMDGPKLAKYLLSVPDQFVWSRQWFVPPPGKLFLPLDYSQIEPRCLHYLAGNDALLDIIRSGFSVYEAYARVAKGWKGAKGTLKKEIGVARYTLIKNEVLGLGYGMGASKYESYAGVDAATAKVTVDSFRRTNPKVVCLWKEFDELIGRAALAKETLEVKMLTGDVLRHFHVRASAGRRGGYESFTTLGDFGHLSLQPSLWGGTLTENCLAGDAEVLTDRGWVELRAVRSTDLVHDGVEFVSHSGLVSRGSQKTISIKGIRATPDHHFLFNDEWHPAYSGAADLFESPTPLAGAPVEPPGHPRDEVRIPDGCGADRHDREEVFDLLNCGPRTRFVVRPPGASYCLIAHNCVQRMARDIIAEAVLRLESAGFQVAFTAHDEAVLVVDPDNKDDAKAEAEHIMSQPPEWAPGLPLAVEGEFSDRYSK